MAFTDYRSIDDVLRKHKLRLIAEEVLPPAADAPPFDEHFLREITLSLHYLRPGRSSEIGSGEILLFPILREVWKSYREDLCLFTHEELAYDDDLRGVPDYFVCPLSEYGRIPDVPYLLVAEAKLDDFDRAWGQCGAAMLAAQKLNQTPDVPVYGIATNGRAWELGALLGREFTLDQRSVAVGDMATLGQTLHAVFRAVHAQAVAHRRTLTPTA